MNEKQREKVKAAVETILKGHSSKNRFMGYGDAYDILRDYLEIYEIKKGIKKSERSIPIEIDETEDTEVIMSIIKSLLTSKAVREEIKLFRKKESL